MDTPDITGNSINGETVTVTKGLPGAIRERTRAVFRIAFLPSPPFSFFRFEHSALLMPRRDRFDDRECRNKIPAFDVKISLRRNAIRLSVITRTNSGLPSIRHVVYDDVVP